MDVMIEINDEKPVIEELCRLCANTDKHFIPIFQGEGIEHNIAEQIKNYLPIITVNTFWLIRIRKIFDNFDEIKFNQLNVTFSL